MSEENVEIVRKLIAAWNEHDEALATSYLADDINGYPLALPPWIACCTAAARSVPGGLLRFGRPGRSFASRRRRSATCTIRLSGWGAFTCADAPATLNSTKSSQTAFNCVQA